jgi:hypothetical protein
LNAKTRNIQTILEIFRLIEERDPRKPNTQRDLELVDQHVEMNWPASLPYGSILLGPAYLPPTGLLLPVRSRE